MPVQPHPVQITVKDADGNVQADVNVYISNTDKGVESKLENDENGDKIVTDSNGVALIDAANLPVATGQTNQYNQGDKILIIAYDGENHDASLYTVQGEDHTLTLQLNPITHSTQLTTQRIMAILAANTSGGNLFAKVYSVDDGEILAHIEVLANDSVAVMFGSFGKSAAGGFVVERESTDIVVTATVK